MGYYYYVAHADKEFGIPEQKKFPLDSRDHVMSAIRFFNYADPKYEKSLASRIISKIHEYDISGLTPSKDNRFFNYYNPPATHLEEAQDFVAHHGILGMHWGDRNGPPYPLSGAEHNSVVKQAKGGSSGSGDGRESAPVKKKMSWSEKRKAKKLNKQRNENLAKARDAAKAKRESDAEKERIVSKGSAEEIYARRNELTNDQKQRAIQRLNLDQQLSDLSAKERAKKKSKVDKLLSTADKVSKGLTTAYAIANTARNIHKLFSDDDGGDSEVKAKRAAIESGDPRKLNEYKGKLSGKEYTEAKLIRNSQHEVDDLIKEMDRRDRKETADAVAKAQISRAARRRVEEILNS